MAWIVMERIEKFVSKATGEVVDEVDTGWGVVSAAGSYPDVHIFDTEEQARDWASIYEDEPTISDWYDGVIVYLSVTVEYAAVHDHR